MRRLIFCKGLPGSGKSTWAREQVMRTQRDGYQSLSVRVNKDDIRRELGCSSLNGQPWSEKTEKEVIKIRNTQITNFLKMGLTVISDDTNLAPVHERVLRNIAMGLGAEFEVKSFLDVPIETCIERDATRPEGERVGKDVIWDMHKKYLTGGATTLQVVVYGNPTTLPSCVICDLDGTLALHEGLRGPYEHEKAANDKLNEPVDRLLGIYASMDIQVVYLSGREDKFRPETEAFLDKHNCTQGPLYMRPTGDHRNDTIVKSELFDAHIRGKYHVEFCLDDRPRVLRLWQSIGLTTFAVGKIAIDAMEEF